jgi:hypothetical protein
MPLRHHWRLPVRRQHFIRTEMLLSCVTWPARHGAMIVDERTARFASDQWLTAPMRSLPAKTPLIIPGLNRNAIARFS